MIEQWRLDRLRKTMSDAFLEKFEHELDVRNRAYETRLRRLNAIARRINDRGIEVRQWTGLQQKGREFIVPGTMASRYCLCYWTETGSRAGIIIYYRDHVRHISDPFSWSEQIKV